MAWGRSLDKCGIISLARCSASFVNVPLRLGHSGLGGRRNGPSSRKAHNDGRRRTSVSRSLKVCIPAGKIHSSTLLFQSTLPPSTLLSNFSQTHTWWNRYSPGVEPGNHAAAPLARLIKPGHLRLLPHLEQVAPSLAGLPAPLYCTAKQWRLQGHVRAHTHIVSLWCRMQHLHLKLKHLNHLLGESELSWAVFVSQKKKKKMLTNISLLRINYPHIYSISNNILYFTSVVSGSRFPRTMSCPFFLPFFAFPASLSAEFWHKSEHFKLKLL